MKNKILVLFERSGAVSVPFRAAGYDVTTVDIEPHLVDNEHHIQCDINYLDLDWSQYQLLVAFPPCTFFSRAQTWRTNRDPERQKQRTADLEMVKRLWALPIKRKCFENPRGSSLNRLCKPSNCKIDYKDYCDYFAKKTDLWLDNLPPLLPRWQNLTDYGDFIQSLPHGKYSGFARSITPREVGEAMLQQWQHLLIK